MKITKIKLCNLASIDGEAVIDFEQEPLHSAGIFAISGPTGSGKSTVLDALCLALYDKTPRFSSTAESALIADHGNEQINQSDVRNILRRGTSEGYAEVEFIAVNGDRYSSKWTVKRARNAASGKLQQQRMSVFNMDRDTELPGTKTELLSQLVGLIGLSYDQFTRTVLLAQNDFATFLKSKENSKAELLEKLTGTEVYSLISKRIFERSKEEKSRLDQLKMKMDDVHLIPDEELQLITNKLEQLGISIAKNEKDLDAYKKRAEVFLRKKKTEAEHHTALSNVEVLTKSKEKAKNDIEDHQNVINAFNEKCIGVQEEIEKATSLDGSIISSKEHLDLAKKKLEGSNSLLTHKQKELDSKSKAVSVLANQFESIFNSLGLPADIEKNIVSVTAYLTSELNQLTTTQLELETSLAGINLDNLTTRRRALDTDKELFQVLKSDFQIFNNSILNKGRLQKEMDELQLGLRTKNTTLIELKQKLEKCETQRAQTEKLFHEVQIRMSETAQSLRSSLVDGQRCPVCGSTEHFIDAVQTDAEFSVLGKALSEQNNEIDNLRSSVATVSQENIHLEVDINKVITSIDENQVCLEELTKKHIAGHLSEEYIQEKLLELKRIEEVLSLETKEYNDLNSSFKHHIAKKDKLQESKNKLNENERLYSESKSEITVLEKELKLLSEQYSDLKNQFTQEDSAYQKLVSERSMLLKGKSVSDSKAAIEKYSQQYTSKLKELEKTHLDVCSNFSTLQGRIEQLKENIEGYNLELKDVKEEDNQTMLVNLSTKIDDERNEISQSTLIVKQQEENKKNIQNLKTQYNKQLGVAEQWAKLSALFGSSDGVKFTKIAQSYTLHILLLHANKHLSYLARRYKLEQVADSLSLQVIDQDMCDQVRTVYSLSGGESFLISLALALGLSSLSSNNLKVESLFIDEGFGSLDSESLRTAMDALEQLQIQGRKIGVISHVQEMSERIPVQIHLNKGNSGKSSLSVIG